MKRIVSLESPELHYHADVCRVECIDDRFRTAMEALTRQEGWSHFDRLQLPGGAKALATEDPTKPGVPGSLLLEQIGISLRLHNSDKVVLTAHQGCGAYGSAMPVEHGAALKFLTSELRKAHETVRTYLVGMDRKVPIYSYAVMFDGVYEVD